MKPTNRTLLTLVIFALAVTVSGTRAQSTYTSYAFTNFVGLPRVSGTNDGPGTAARFYTPGSVALDTSDNVYVTDYDNHTIRKITPAGLVTTLAGRGGVPGAIDGPGNVARFNGPATLDVDSHGIVYVTDDSNNTIRKITPAGVVTTLAGLAGTPGSNDGTGNMARFNNPIGVAVDSATNVYVADYGNHTIRKITPDGVVTTLAGSAGKIGSADGTGGIARFNEPHHVRVDSAGNIYVADSGNHTIRKVTPTGVVTTLAGKAGTPGSADGSVSVARFNYPTGVYVTTNGNVYVVDNFGSTIRRITPAGAVTTLAGRALYPGSVDGIGSAARFNGPFSVSMDRAGNVYVADGSNNRITKGIPALQFETMARNLAVTNGLFHMRLLGPSTSNVVVEASGDLNAWTPIQTNTLSPANLELSVPLSTNEYFRARLAP